MKSTKLSEESKKKWNPVFIADIMSSEESDGTNDEASFTVRPLLWRSDKVTRFFNQLDDKKNNNSTQRSKRMSFKRKMGLPSDRPPPPSLPTWMLKN